MVLIMHAHYVHMLMRRGGGVVCAAYRNRASHQPKAANLQPSISSRGGKA